MDRSVLGSVVIDCLFHSRLQRGSKAICGQDLSAASFPSQNIGERGWRRAGNVDRWGWVRHRSFSWPRVPCAFARSAAVTASAPSGDKALRFACNSRSQRSVQPERRTPVKLSFSLIKASATCPGIPPPESPATRNTRSLTCGKVADRFGETPPLSRIRLEHKLLIIASYLQDRDGEEKFCRPGMRKNPDSSSIYSNQSRNSKRQEDVILHQELKPKIVEPFHFQRSTG
ncbi:uncharacterized protein [Mobula birostris]|uniref:uncharacterized protein n=1 Tax=Mobula birostris TaxID=1983395 RepID=UPI003B28A22B